MLGKSALLCGVCSVASAQPVAMGTVNSGLPPERFRGNAAALVYFTDRTGVEQLCGTAEPPNIMIACKRSFAGDGVIVIMPNPCLIGEAEFFAKIMCHEMGHVQGWGGNHEQ